MALRSVRRAQKVLPQPILRRNRPFLFVSSGFHRVGLKQNTRAAPAGNGKAEITQTKCLRCPNGYYSNVTSSTLPDGQCFKKNGFPITRRQYLINNLLCMCQSWPLDDVPMNYESIVPSI